MKRIQHFLLAVTFTCCAWTLQAQNAPAGINYQAVLRDAQGQILADQSIKIRVSVLDPESRNTFFTETHQITTSNLGIFNLVIGGGKAEKGTFNGIPWSTANTWLEVAYDTDNNGIYDITGTTRMLSVPYAFYAEKAGSAVNSLGPVGTEGGGGDVGGDFAWMLKGNDNVDENVMWLGTRNRADLVIKTHDKERIRITKGMASDSHDALIDLQEDVLAEKSLVVGTTLQVGGQTLLQNELMVAGNVFFNSDMDLLGNAKIGKLLWVKGNLNTDGDVVFNQDLTVLDDASFWGDVKIDGNLNVHHSLFVDIDGDFGRNLHVGNDADIDHNLNVDNDGHIGRDLDIDRNLNVDNNAHIGKDLDVDGTGTFFNLVVENDLKVGRDADIDRNLNVDVNVHVGQDLDVDRNLNVDVNGHFGQDVDIDRNLNVDNNVVIHEDITVDDDASIGGVLSVDGNLEANCRLIVTSCVSGVDSDPDNYPVYVKGGNQGVYIEVTGGRSSANNFATFADNSAIWGRVEGQTLDELHNSFEYIWTHSMNALGTALNIASAVAAGLSIPPDLAEVAVAGAEAVVAVAEWLEWGINADLKIGVAYESGSGDYAEWLERANPAEDLNYGEIVGVRGGKIGRNTAGSEHVMVISFAPIVLGNMPDPARAGSFEKVAFMGQVPVRVMGKVAVGDYILPSGFNDGFGKAVNPAKMRTEDYTQIVGVAWQGGESMPMNLVNVAVGINANDLATRVTQQQREIDQMKQQMNQLFTLLGQKSPYEGLEPVASAPVAVNPVAPKQFGGISKAETKQLLEVNRAAIEDVFAKTRADLEKQGANINKYPEIAALYRDPVQWITDQQEKGYLDEMLIKAGVQSRN